MSFIEQYLLQLNTEKRRWRRAVVILTGLSLIVALVTVWNLRMTGITIANGAACGYEEHLHTEECLQDEAFICGYTDVEGNRYTFAITSLRYEKHADQTALAQKDAALTLFMKNVYSFEYLVVFCDVLY